MHLFTFLRSILTIFLLHIHISLSLRWDGNILYDLESTDIFAFAADAEAWFLSSYRSPGAKISLCAGAILLGGYGILGGNGYSSTSNPYHGQYFQRTYTSLPSHNQIFLQMRFYALDSWDGLDYSDSFRIEINGNVVQGYLIYAWGPGASKLCGRMDDIDDNVFTIYLAIWHYSSSSLELKVRNLSDEDSLNESFGFREIKIAFVSMASPYFSLCQIGASFSSPYCLTSCQNTENVITPSNSGFCYPSYCDSNCKTCSETSTICTTCNSGSYLVGTTCYVGCDEPLAISDLGGVAYCTTPCPGQFVWWDKSCSSVCSYSTSYGPLAVKGVLINTFWQCTYSCSTSEYLYWNSVCLDSCPFPLTKTIYKDRNFCEFSCVGAQYLYWNGSCLDTCPEPLTSEIKEDGKKFCWFVCLETQYLYWNGSCHEKCDFPLVPETQDGGKFCWYRCSETQYLYWNGSCIDTCPSPLISEVQGTDQSRKFCWYGCSESQYLYWNGSCLDTCPSPLTPETQQGTSSSRKFCWYGCSETQYLYWNGSCADKCDLPLILEVQGTEKSRNFCWYPCSETKYLYWNGSCLDTCPSPLNPETQQGTLSSRKFCWYGCSETQYLYWNGSCLDTCPLPLTLEIQQGTSSNRKFCWYECQPDEYLYWDGSCHDKCDSPLDSEIQGTYKSRNFCWSPCQGDKYVYWNRSCLSECPTPLAKKIETDMKFCVNPCEYSSYYLFSNQSCFSTCPSPLSTISNPGVQYCVNLCPPGTYLYENKTCLSTCSSPYLKRIEPDVLYCDRPCSQTNIYWYQNASCLPNCEAPYVQFNYSGIIQCLPPCKEDAEYFNDNEKKCYSTCESPYKIELVDVIKVCKVGVDISVKEVEKIKEAADSIKTQGEFTSGGMKAASAINSNSPSSALLAGLSSMMQYIRYMKINYPPKVQMLFMVSADAPISLGFDFDIPSFIKEHLIDEPLPDAFDKYEINSNFVSNLWGFMTSLVLILMAIIVLAILKIITSGLPRFNAVVTRVLQVLKWNFPIMMICGSSGDIFFYASLQLRSSPFTNLSSTICCIISILMMILVVLLLAIAFKIARVIHREPRNHAQESWKGFEILYSEYEEKSFFSLAYMLVFISRGIIFNLTLATLFDYPMVQCVIINTCNIAMICYIFYLRPLKNLLSLVQLWINEGLVNTLSVSILILGVLDHMGINREATRVGIGNVILFAIKTFNTAGLVFMGIGMLVFAISMFRTLKTLREKNIKSPVKLLKALIFGVPEPEKVDPAGKEEFAKKPKIVKPLRKERTWTREENSSVIEMKEEKSMIHLISDNSHQVLPTNILQTEWKDEQVSRDLDISQSFFNPQKKVSPKTEEKNGSLVRVCNGRVQGREDILEGSKEELEKRSEEDETKLWYSKLRKLKRRLNNSSKKIDLTIETDSRTGVVNK